MTCGLIGVRRVLFRQRYRIRRPEKKRNRLLIRAVRWKKSESFPESRSGLRSESEYDFVLRENFRRNSSDISNGRHREFLWGTVNRRIGIRFRHVLRAGRSDVDGRLLTNVSRVSRTSTDFRSLHRNSPPIAAPSARRLRADFVEGFGKTFGGGRSPQRVVRKTRPTAYFVKTNSEKEVNRRTLKSVAKSRGKSRERADGAGRRLRTEDT